MDLRHTIRRKGGKVHRYWRLVQSVRVGRRVIQQTVAQLGELDEHGRIAARGLARRLIGAPDEAPLFKDGSEHLTAPVRLQGVRIERSRQFGDGYLALALWRGVGLEELCKRLLPPGQERVAWAKMAAVLVTARLCEPSSELHIAEDWCRRAALCDLLQLGDEEVNKDRLYRALDRLLAHKGALEAHLSARCGELFAADNDVMLYDVTSTYFEGQAKANPQSPARLLPRSSPRLQAGLAATLNFIVPIELCSKGRGCVKTSALFHTNPFRSLFRGLRAFRIGNIAKNFALLDRLQNFAKFPHSLGRFRLSDRLRGGVKHKIRTTDSIRCSQVAAVAMFELAPPPRLGRTEPSGGGGIARGQGADASALARPYAHPGRASFFGYIFLTEAPRVPILFFRWMKGAHERARRKAAASASQSAKPKGIFKGRGS